MGRGDSQKESQISQATRQAVEIARMEENIVADNYNQEVAKFRAEAAKLFGKSDAYGSRVILSAEGSIEGLDISPELLQKVDRHVAHSQGIEIPEGACPDCILHPGLDSNSEQPKTVCRSCHGSTRSQV